MQNTLRETVYTTTASIAAANPDCVNYLHIRSSDRGYSIMLAYVAGEQKYSSILSLSEAALIANPHVEKLLRIQLTKCIADLRRSIRVKA